MRDLTGSPCVRVQPPHHGAVFGVGGGLDGAQLVQHFADDDDAGPHRAHAGGQRPELAVRESKGPAHQEDVIKERHLGNKDKDIIIIIIINIIIIIIVIILLFSITFIIIFTTIIITKVTECLCLACKNALET